MRGALAGMEAGLGSDWSLAWLDDEAAGEVRIGFWSLDCPWRKGRANSRNARRVEFRKQTIQHPQAHCWLYAMEARRVAVNLRFSAQFRWHLRTCVPKSFRSSLGSEPCTGPGFLIHKSTRGSYGQTFICKVFREPARRSFHPQSTV